MLHSSLPCSPPRSSPHLLQVKFDEVLVVLLHPLHHACAEQWVRQGVAQEAARRADGESNRGGSGGQGPERAGRRRGRDCLQEDSVQGRDVARHRVPQPIEGELRLRELDHHEAVDDLLRWARLGETRSKNDAGSSDYRSDHKIANGPAATTPRSAALQVVVRSQVGRRGDGRFLGTWVALVPTNVTCPQGQPVPPLATSEGRRGARGEGA
eukprot:2382495-Prymnesium_polylepis.2